MGSLFGEGGSEHSAKDHLERRSGGSRGGEWITAYCDGGSRGNPGPAGFGVYIEGAKGEKLAELSEYLGKTTNNVAEYSGLLAALEYALKSGYGRLRVIADSELMVKQMQGKYRVNSPDLRPLYEEAKRRESRLDGFRIEHVLRGKNKNADRLANLAMDKGMGKTVLSVFPFDVLPGEADSLVALARSRRRRRGGLAAVVARSRGRLFSRATCGLGTAVAGGFR